MLVNIVINHCTTTTWWNNGGRSNLECHLGNRSETVEHRYQFCDYCLQSQALHLPSPLSTTCWIIISAASCCVGFMSWSLMMTSLSIYLAQGSNDDTLVLWKVIIVGCQVSCVKHYYSYFEGHVFSPHPVPHRKDAPWLTHTHWLSVTIYILRKRRNVMYTSYHLVQTLDSYCHRNILNVILYGSQCDINRKSRFIKIIHILWLPWQHRTLYNHYLRPFQ